MAKKKLTSIDFQFGILMVTPSTQEAFLGGHHCGKIRKSEKASIKKFRKMVFDTLSENAEKLSQFPTQNEVFIFILQYFVSKEKYKSRDIDNMAKTILDTLKGKFYHDDSQVKTLLISKKMGEKKVPQPFAYMRGLIYGKKEGSPPYHGLPLVQSKNMEGNKEADT